MIIKAFTSYTYIIKSLLHSYNGRVRKSFSNFSSKYKKSKIKKCDFFIGSTHEAYKQKKIGVEVKINTSKTNKQTVDEYLESIENI